MKTDPLVIVLVVVTIVVVVAFLRRRDSASWTPSSESEHSFLSAPKYFRFFAYTSVIVPDTRGTTEVDVIVVGNSGVFVVELKHYNGWIFGEADAETWTVSYVDGAKHQFQNPLRQNFRHVKALEARTGLPFEVFHSLVVFTGNCELKTPMPSNVVVGGYREFIENTKGVRLTDAEAQRVCQVVEELEAASTPDAINSHVFALQERFANPTICPKCGGRLVERRARSSSRDMPPFLGCQSFPRCRYTRPIDTL